MDFATLKAMAGKPKEFALDLIELPDIEATTLETGRTYETPDGVFPSVTTFLKQTQPQSKTDTLDAWRDRVGHEEAARITNQSATRGTLIHESMEDRVLGRPVDMAKLGKWGYMYKQICTITESRLSVVRGSEVGLWSTKIRLAGRCDLIGVWDGRLSIIDFKNARRPRKRDWCDDYFLQMAIYSMMLEEMTGIVASQLVVVIAVEGEIHGQCLTAERRDYLPELARRVHQFRGKQLLGI